MLIGYNELTANRLSCEKVFLALMPLTVAF